MIGVVEGFMTRLKPVFVFILFRAGHSSSDIVHDHPGEYFVNYVPPLGKDALSDWPSVFKPITVNYAKRPNPKPLVPEQFAEEVFYVSLIACLAADGGTQFFLRIGRHCGGEIRNLFGPLPISTHLSLAGKVS